MKTDGQFNLIHLKIITGNRCWCPARPEDGKHEIHPEELHAFIFNIEEVRV
jgi:hypothetical protein